MDALNVWLKSRFKLTAWSLVRRRARGGTHGDSRWKHRRCCGVFHFVAEEGTWPSYAILTLKLGIDGC